MRGVEVDGKSRGGGCLIAVSDFHTVVVPNSARRLCIS